MNAPSRFLDMHNLWINCISSDTYSFHGLASPRIVSALLCVIFVVRDETVKECCDPAGPSYWWAQHATSICRVRFQGSDVRALTSLIALAPSPIYMVFIVCINFTLPNSFFVVNSSIYSASNAPQVISNQNFRGFNNRIFLRNSTASSINLKAINSLLCISTPLLLSAISLDKVSDSDVDVVLVMQWREAFGHTYNSGRSRSVVQRIAIVPALSEAKAKAAEVCNSINSGGICVTFP